MQVETYGKSSGYFVSTKRTHAGQQEVKYRVKTKHAQSGVDFADRIFAGSDAEFFSDRHTNRRGYLDNDPFIWGIKCLPYSF